MKHLKLYENFNFNDEDFDFEEEYPNNYKQYISNYSEDDNGIDHSDKIYYIKVNYDDKDNFIEKLDDNFELIEDGTYNDDGVGDQYVYFILWSDNQFSIESNDNAYDRITKNKEIVTINEV